MLRIVLGVIAGFLGWVVLWVGVEKVISAVSPNWFGAHQTAFQTAIENGGLFTPDSTALLIHIVMGLGVSIAAGYLASLIAGENNRAPFILGLLLLAMGIMKLVMSWKLVPLWYHIGFTVILLPMAIIGGKLRRGN